MKKKLYLFTIQAIPNKDNPEINEFGGAYASVWVDNDNITKAEEIARKHIHNEAWEPIKTIEIVQISQVDYKSDDPSLENFNEAIQCGSSLVFNTWPKDCKDKDVEYK